MKVPIDDYAVIDLNAPTLPAVQVRNRRSGAMHWRVWCRHCGAWHYHGVGEGHREAHCTNPASRYNKTGYNLALVR